MFGFQANRVSEIQTKVFRCIMAENQTFRKLDSYQKLTIKEKTLLKFFGV